MPQSADLTGKRVGLLTVLEKTEKRRDRHILWRCRCDCGNEKLVTTGDLKSGNCKSCGCLRKRAGRNITDLTGQRFGRLVALHPTEKRDKKRSVFWLCQCDCGNFAEVTESNLVYGTYCSCGCLRQEYRKNVAKNMHWIDGTCVELLEGRKRTDNTSGCRGVCRMKNNKFRADIAFKGKRFYIGTFEKIEDAVRAREQAEEKIYGGFTDAYRAWKERSGGNPEWEKAHPLVYEVEKVDGDFVITCGKE